MPELDFRARAYQIAVDHARSEGAREEREAVVRWLRAAVVWGYAAGASLIVVGSLLAFGWEVGLIAVGAVVLWGVRP